MRPSIVFPTIIDAISLNLKPSFMHLPVTHEVGLVPSTLATKLISSLSSFLSTYLRYGSYFCVSAGSLRTAAFLFFCEPPALLTEHWSPSEALWSTPTPSSPRYLASPSSSAFPLSNTSSSAKEMPCEELTERSGDDAANWRQAGQKRCCTEMNWLCGAHCCEER